MIVLIFVKEEKMIYFDNSATTILTVQVQIPLIVQALLQAKVQQHHQVQIQLLTIPLQVATPKQLSNRY